jgi:hypothetical protein
MEGYEKLLNDVMLGQGNERKVQQEIGMIGHRLMDDVVRRDSGKVLGVHTVNCLHVVAY